MVPTLTCGLPRSNFSLATSVRSCRESRYWLPLARRFRANQRKLSQIRISCRLGRDRLPGAPLDHLLGDVGRHLVIAVELHRRRRAALRVGTQVRHVAEHLAQRHLGRDGERVAAPLLTLDPAAAAAAVAYDVAPELLRGDDLDREDRLEEDRLGAACGLLEGQRSGDLERDLR